MKYISILQLKNEGCPYASLSFDAAKSLFDITDYHVVHRAYRPTEQDDIDICEEMFDLFHTTPPKDASRFTGRNTGVSDIIRIDNTEKSNPRFYYCDTIGWKDIMKHIK